MPRVVVCLLSALLATVSAGAVSERDWIDDAAEIRGHVYDTENGKSVRHSVVYAVGDTHVAFSEVDWTFSYLVPAGEYRLVATHPGYLRAEQLVTLSPRETLVCSLGLDRAVSYDRVSRRASTPGGLGWRRPPDWFTDTVVAPLAEVVVEGQVVERGTGRPVAGACVFVEGTDHGTVSDKAGRFRFRAPSGTHRLVAAYYCRYEQWDTTVVLGFEPTMKCRPVLRPIAVDVTLPPERRQSGVVFWNRLDGGDEEVGEGLGRVMGWLWDRTTGREAGNTEVWPDNRKATWLASARYLFELTPGPHVIRALKRDHGFVSDEVKVTLGKTLRRDLSMVPLFLPESMPSHDRKAPRLAAGEPLFPAEDSGKWGYIDRQGRVVIEPRFSAAEPFSDGRAWVCEGSNWRTKWGAIDRSGEFVIQPTYSRVGPFSEGLAAVSQGDGFGFVDTTGRMVISPAFTQVGQFSEGLAWASTERYSKGPLHRFGYIDTTGQFVVGDRYKEAAEFSEGLAAVAAPDSGFGYISKQGEWVVLPTFLRAQPFSEGLAAVMVFDSTSRWEDSAGGRWGSLVPDRGYEAAGPRFGYIDRQGRFIIPPVLHGAWPFYEGVAGVCRKRFDWCEWGRDWAYIDSAGTLAVESVWRLYGNTPGPFKEGLAAISYVEHVIFQDAPHFLGIGYYVDRSGRPAFTRTFNEVGDFEHGIARVKWRGHYHYIDRTGRFIW
ncbi:WG repeat-containing protein [candidate division WOR-3 bacterium]|nr:WG repeat-containing protein [candidate division WOR-3 bacterium]